MLARTSSPVIGSGASGQAPWDVRRSRVDVVEGEGGKKWSQKVGELPPNVQEIIARGGLEKWVQAQIGK